MLKKLLIVFLSVIFLCGCTGKKNAEEITFSSWGSVTEVKIIKEILSDFEKENPDIKVKFMHIPQNYYQKIHLLFASNTAPDIIFINNLYLPVYATKLEDLSPYINKKVFYPQSISGMSYGGQIYAIPRDISMLVFYVNTDILKNKGQTIPNENWTINDLLNLGVQTTDSKTFGISYEDNIYMAQPYLSYFGGGILSNNGIIIESDESQQGLSFYKALRYRYHIVPLKSEIGSSTLAQMFLDKKIALYLSGRWMYPKITEKADFNWTIINFPKSEYGYLSDTSGWAVSKNSKHKKSAIKLAQFLASEKSSEYFTKTGLIVPARVEVSKKLLDEPHNSKVFIDIIKDSHPTPVNKNYRKLTDDINRKIEW